MQNSYRVKVIIAILGIGGLITATKIYYQKQVVTMMKHISDIGATVAQNKTFVSEILNKYNRDYTLFLYKNSKLPSGLSYINGIVQAANDAKIKATVDANGVVIIEVSNLNTDSCVKIATTNFGNYKTTRFVGVGIGMAPDFSCLATNSCKFDYIAAYSGTSDYPFTKDRAMAPCSLFEKAKQPGVVYLGYKL